MPLKQDLPNLNRLNEMLIARVHVCQRIYFKSYGMVGYKG